MKFQLVSTRNVARIMDAAKALEKRLADDEIMGMGLVFGRPGLGKTLAVTSYHARSSTVGRVRTVFVRAMDHWNEGLMLKALLRSMGASPRAYQKGVMFDQLQDAIGEEPPVIIVDEVNKFVESRKMIGMLKDIHDVTGCAILMVGEERVDQILRRHESFYDRINLGALVHVRDQSLQDVHAVIQQRCEWAVDPDVCDEIYTSVGRMSMRRVIDQIRKMESFAVSNGLKRITMADYRKMPKGPGDAVGTERTPIRVAKKAAHAEVANG